MAVLKSPEFLSVWMVLVFLALWCTAPSYFKLYSIINLLSVIVIQRLKYKMAITELLIIMGANLASPIRL